MNKNKIIFIGAVVTVVVLITFVVLIIIKRNNSGPPGNLTTLKAGSESTISPSPTATSLPKTNPFDVKTNPFKGVRTNPFQ